MYIRTTRIQYTTTDYGSDWSRSTVEQVRNVDLPSNVSCHNWRWPGCFRLVQSVACVLVHLLNVVTNGSMIARRCVAFTLQSKQLLNSNYCKRINQIFRASTCRLDARTIHQTISSPNSSASNPTIFGKILEGQIPTTLLYEDDDVNSFKLFSPIIF